ncbi:rhombosortase [Variovorax sp. PCZ-1]|uniref:rhombosortase n=1 Tax=Variovorax sp. PCZ-1 TaxID=2835533 RepID=UPI001BCC7E14|nr:rhombosortase [Variovorax sp. PCZ-1]MBS7808654.1 rhombosortase [Variovorax sp. PCZ-1]
MRPLQAFAWSGLCATLAALCIAVWLLPTDVQIAMRWQADTWVSQPWTLWTASLTHLSDVHLLVNLLALLGLGVLGQLIGMQRVDALALLLAWPLLHMSLLLWPQIQFYAGFSGLNHALAGVIVARSAINLIVNRRCHMLAFPLTAVLFAKMIWEMPWEQPLRMDASWGFSVVQAAHLTGVVAGMFAVAAIQLARIFFTKAVVE